MKKKLLACFLALAMLVGLFPSTALAVETQDISSTGLTVTADDAEQKEGTYTAGSGTVTVEFDSESATVTFTLTDAALTGPLLVTGALNAIINLSGKNSINCGTTADAINVAGGTLTVNGPGSLAATGNLHALYGDKGITIERAAIDATGNVDSAIWSIDTISISDSTVTAKCEVDISNEENRCGYGIYVYGYGIDDPGSIYISNSIVMVTASRISFYTEHDITITGSLSQVTVETTGTDSNGGYNGLFADKNITISDGASVSGSSTSSTLYAGEKIEIDGSTVHASSTDNCGIFSPGKVKISSSDVTSEGYYPGLNGKSGIAIQNGSKVTATASNDCGIFSPAEITIESSEVYADGTVGIISNVGMNASESWVRAENGIEIRNGGTYTPVDSVTIQSGGEVAGNARIPQGALVEVGDTINIPEDASLSVGDPAKTIQGEVTGITVDANKHLVLPAGTVIESADGTKQTIGASGGKITLDGEVIAAYTVTVENDGNGTAFAAPDSATAGTNIDLTATPNPGYKFKEWQVVAGGATITGNSFTMPAADVTVKATFEPNITPPVHIHAWAGAWTTDAAHHWHECAAGDCDISDNSKKDGYAAHTPGDWIVDAQPTASAPGQQHKACTVCGHITQTEAIPATGGSSGGGGGGGSSTSPTYKPDVPQPSEGGKVEVKPSNPERGDIVTITPKPDEGYQIKDITVTDKNGKPVEVTKDRDGKYTFTQPGSKVTIEITFEPVPLVELPWVNPFTDVSEGDWFYEAVRFVQERGLMNGYSDGRFGPNDPLSRAQLAQILFNNEGRPGVNYLLDFSDVAQEAWYTEAIRWATSRGIVGGYGNGKFGPNDPITREQLAVMLWRYSGSPAATNKELHFNDADEISGFALEAMRWAVEKGILNGYGDGRLGPQGQATRAQVAQMLKNFIENRDDNI